MAGVLFVTWDGGGNLPPALGIGAELQRRGHTVRFLGHRRQRDLVEVSGFRFEAYTRARPWSSARQRHGFKGPLDLVSVFSDTGPGEDLVASASRESTDLVVADCLLFGALEAAERAGLPRAVLMHTFYPFLLRTWARGPMGRLVRMKGRRPLRLWSGADLTVVTTLRELEPAATAKEGWPLRHTGVVWQGTPSPSRPGAEPLVLVSLSTTDFPGQAAALQSILDGLSGLPVRVIATTGPAVSPAMLRPPKNAEVRQFVPHADLMPEASLVVTHGGHATAMLALAHDVPLLVMPMHPMLDQPMIGRSLEAHGAARMLSKKASPEAIRTAARDLLNDDAYRRAAADLGARIRERDGAATAVDTMVEAGLLPPAVEEGATPSPEWSVREHGVEP